MAARLSRRQRLLSTNSCKTQIITGLVGNVKLQKITAHWLDTAVASYKTTGEEVRMFHSFMYKANSWKHQQRVVVK